MTTPPGERGGLRQRPVMRKGRFTHVFRARITEQQMATIKENVAAGVGGIRSQQEYVRAALDWFDEELDRAQGVVERLPSRLVTTTVDVGRVAPPKPRSRHKRTTTPEVDPAKRDGRSVEDRAIGRLRAHLRQYGDE